MQILLNNFVCFDLYGDVACIHGAMTLFVVVVGVLDSVPTLVIKVSCGAHGLFHCEGCQVTTRTASSSV